VSVRVKSSQSKNNPENERVTRLVRVVRDRNFYAFIMPPPANSVEFVFEKKDISIRNGKISIQKERINE
jgi:hypothetical protein